MCVCVPEGCLLNAKKKVNLGLGVGPSYNCVMKTIKLVNHIDMIAPKIKHGPITSLHRVALVKPPLSSFNISHIEMML